MKRSIMLLLTMALLLAGCVGKNPEPVATTGNSPKVQTGREQNHQDQPKPDTGTTNPGTGDPGTGKAEPSKTATGAPNSVAGDPGTGTAEPPKPASGGARQADTRKCPTPEKPFFSMKDHPATPVDVVTLYLQSWSMGADKMYDAKALWEPTCSGLTKSEEEYGFYIKQISFARSSLEALAKAPIQILAADETGDTAEVSVHYEFDTVSTKDNTKTHWTADQLFDLTRINGRWYISDQERLKYEPTRVN